MLNSKVLSSFSGVIMSIRSFFLLGSFDFIEYSVMSDTESSVSSKESSSDDNSDAFEYSSSSDSDSISSQDNAEEIEIPEDYEPEGAESDDDRHKCCQWTTQQQQHFTVCRRRGVLDMGGSSQIKAGTSCSTHKIDQQETDG